MQNTLPQLIRCVTPYRNVPVWFNWRKCKYQVNSVDKEQDFCEDCLKKKQPPPQTIDDKRANHKELQLYAGGCLT